MKSIRKDAEQDEAFGKWFNDTLDSVKGDAGRIESMVDGLAGIKRRGGAFLFEPSVEGCELHVPLCVFVDFDRDICDSHYVYDPEDAYIIDNMFDVDGRRYFVAMYPDKKIGVADGVIFATAIIRLN